MDAGNLNNAWFIVRELVPAAATSGAVEWTVTPNVDDALMAPVNLNHFDGYAQGPSTLTKYKSLEHVPGLDAGGWHDAGDYDLRIESQMGTTWLLAKMIEEFGLDYDATTIDEEKKLVLIHQPDGKNDAVQQIEHGLLTVLGGYHALGRLYRGIQDATLHQYTLLGEAANSTDNVIGKPVDGLGNYFRSEPIPADDRLVFTEDNPDREIMVAVIWGAGWIVQEFGVKQWMLHKGWPDLVPVANFVNALNFVFELPQADGPRLSGERRAAGGRSVRTRTH